MWLVRFEQPWWFLAAVAAALPLAIALWARRRGRQVSALSVTLQCAALVLAAAALAQPALPLGERAEKRLMVLRDVSASVKGQDAPLELPPDLPREACDFAATVGPAGRVSADAATHLGPALRLAAAGAERLAGLVIVTDGRFQDADWPFAAEALGRAGLPVRVVPLESPPPDARIADLSARRRPDGKVDLRATLISNATRTRTLHVFRDGRTDPLRRDGEAGPPSVVLLPHEPATVLLLDDPPADKAATYRARLLGEDAFPQNDVASTAVLPSRQTVALVAAHPETMAKTLADALKLPVRVVAPDDAPADAGGWMDYAAVALADADGTALSAQRRAALAAYVRGGGGLLLVGAGPHASPRDRDDPLNQVAALVANPYERRPLKVTVLLDASGSMAETSPEESPAGRRVKFDLAVEAVMALRRHLTRRDALAVVTFAVTPRLVYDSLDAPPDFSSLQEALRGVRPAGGNPTSVMPALALAAQGPPPREKDGLVILLSDLLTEPLDAKVVDGVEALFRKGRYALSVVAVRTSVPATQELKKTSLEAPMAKLQPTVVRSDSLTGLAEVFAGLLRGARGEPIRRGRFQVKLPPSVLGLAGLALPELDAYILCAEQEGAIALGSAETDPVLAQRQVALGRSVGLAVPLSSGANRALADSPSLGALLAAATRWVMRDEADPRFAGGVERIGDRLHVRIDARDDAGPMCGLSPLLQTTRLGTVGQGSPVERTMAQTSPGRYEADLPAADEPVSVVVRQSDANGPVAWRHVAGATCPAEFAAIGADWENLRRLADQTGGRIVSASRLPAMGRQWARGRYTAVWPHLLAAAAGLVLLEWALGRVLRRG